MSWNDYEVKEEDQKSRLDIQIGLGVWSKSDEEKAKMIAERIEKMQALFVELDVLAEELREEISFSLPKSERGRFNEVSLKWQSSAGTCGYL